MSNYGDNYFKIVLCIPSINIFYPDLTYSFSDCAREYDALIIARVCKHPFILLGEEVSNHKESGKVIIDLTLWHPPVMYVFDKASNYEKFLTPLRLSVRGFSLPRVAQLADLWMSGYELFNLLFYSILFMHQEMAREILNDISGLEGFRSPNLDFLSKLSKCLESIVSGDATHTLEGLNVPEHVGVSSTEYASSIITRLVAEEVVIYLFPQLLKGYEESIVRKYFPINLAVSVLSILSESVNKLYLRVVGSGVGAGYSEYILKELEQLLKKLKIECDVKGIVGEDLGEAISLLKKDAKKIAEGGITPGVLIIVAGDYGKKPITRFIATISSVFRDSEYKVLVFPEVIFRVSEEKKDRLVCTSAPFNSDPSKDDIKSANPLRLMLKKDILLIEGKEARKLMELLAKLNGGEA